MLNIVIFGPPGSGKGTQSCRILEKYSLTHISTGDLMREEMAQDSALGEQIRKYINKGLLVPDEIVICKLNNTIEKHTDAKGFIFDGFPRTINQAILFDDMLDLRATPIDLVISVDVAEEELLKRLAGRSEDSGRSDDKEEIIWKRIDVYKSQSLPLVSYYSQQEKLVKINGMDHVDAVFGKISLAIDTYLEKQEVLTEVR